ncbi:nitrate reductase molybdenum cofactor assembly chaperone [Nonomuraea wenchangensis]|uniref:Respiratory nitrate reductase chaperone NarJ n=1 Tax=Nonomuraea wenchangensis TaxID=568860 RepID=A0A1I0LNG8_9ACTN|nr:nitrate reductase molybdenum cofactor assembly chaperone [Nonomuraea wenchangensis]SEU41899.1 respiratory nitrate reductase chaperone NarJ [Nonomuraea wenchangensis]
MKPPWTSRRSSLSADGVAVVRRAAGLCLRYPDQALFDRLPLIRAALAETGAHPPVAAVAAFAEHLAGQDPLRAEEHYVAVFDLRNRRSLHLTWWSDGDTRRRGFSLAAIKERYRAHGLTPPGSDELPDYLPVVLEYATLEREDGTNLLQEHRAGLELLKFSLVKAATPYARLLEAVCGTLPGASPRTAEEAARMARRPPGVGPELVGLSAVGLPSSHPVATPGGLQ